MPIDGPLGLVLRRGAAPEPPLSRAQAPGFLSHHAIVQWPLTNAWVEALAPLAAGREVLLQHASSLDPLELRVLRRLARRAPRITLTLADEPHSVAADSGRGSIPPRDDRLELRAHETLTSEAPDTQLVLRAVEATWACFGFGACAWFGEELLRLGLPLSPRERRRVHLLVALSLYNGEADRRGDDAVADVAQSRVLDEHLRASLAGETDLRERSHLCYRLALVTGRNAGQLSAAEDLAAEAVHLAAAAGDPLFEAWALNGRAHLSVRLGELDGARRYRRGLCKLARRSFLRADAVCERWDLGPPPPASRWGAAASALRAGRGDDARHDLEQLLADSSRAGERIEVLGLLGVAAARAGDDVSATLRIAEAMSLAAESGEREVLLVVELAAGEASLALGRRGDAESAFRRALALMGTGEPGAPARVAALAGLLDSGAGDAADLQQALDLLESALTDADTWWQLGRLAKAARRLGVGVGHPALAAALAQRCDAASDEAPLSQPARFGAA